MYYKKQQGFTLIELLVVIAIIGILSSVVLASLNTARQKSRDARRISDIGQLQLALELYFDSNRSYPLTTSALVTAGFISVDPTDPLDDTAEYFYAALGSGEICSSYHLAITLEDTDHIVLRTDADAPTEAVCTGGATQSPGGIADFDGADDSLYYDVKP